MSVLQAIESEKSKNPLVNRVLQTCQEILSGNKYITFCWIPSQGISEEMKMLIVQRKMLYQKHSLRNLNFRVQMFFYENPAIISSLWQEQWDKELDNKLHAIMPSCPKVMRSITRDAQIEKMKLLLIAFE